MVSAAVILASGESRRFIAEAGVHKLVYKVAGLPLICYPYTSLSLALHKMIVIVASKYNMEDLKTVLGQCPYSPPETLWVLNREPWRGNGYSAVLGVRAVGAGSILVSVGDHIYPPSLAVNLALSGPISVGCDPRPSYIDVGEATKVLVRRGLVEDIGKGLRHYTHVDVGVYNLSVMAVISVVLPERLELWELARLLVRTRPIKAAVLEGYAWSDVDYVSDAESLERGHSREVVRKVFREWIGYGVRGSHAL